MPALVARNVIKRYGSVVALHDVSAEFRAGQIHAVLGENGAGKSTLMGVLSGFAHPDSGQVLLDGKSIALGKPFECRRLGIEMIHQHFTLVPEFTVEENLALSRLPSLVRSIRAASLAQAALEIGRQLGWEIDPKARVRNLPVGIQQRLEILKALAADASVMIFDEPTAVLGADEVDELFRVLRQLRDQGRTVILIAHKLSEIMRIADRVTVLRHGKVVGEATIGEVTEGSLATWMVGELPTASARPPKVATRAGWTFDDLSIRGDRGEEAVRGVSFDLNRGEILGFGGVDGNGQVELAEYLAGVRNSSPPYSIAYIPQDRQIDGLALNMSIEENMTVTGQRLPELTNGPFLLPEKIHVWAEGLVRRFQIKAGHIDDAAGSLSGGNQQKVVVSRALAEVPEVVVAVNPTRGLDLRAARYVQDQLRAARDSGAAVALFTTDLDELFEVADRRVFLSGGRLTEATDAGAMLGRGA